jgi:hypothetical protein
MRLETLTLDYWEASTQLQGHSRARGTPSKAIAVVILQMIAQSCEHDHLRCAAGGTLVTFGYCDIDNSTFGT